VLRVELRELRTADPGMSLLIAVEFTTSDPTRRIALYRCSANDPNIRSSGVGQDGLAKPSSLVDKDLALLERRARTEGFQV
jgi:hypothetical protein